MAKRKRKTKSKTRARSKPRSRKFLPDRIVGFLTALGPIVALIFLIALGGIASFLLSLGSEGKQAEQLLTTIGPLALIGIGLLICAFFLWISVRTAQGRKIGLIFTAIFAGLALAGTAYTAIQGRPIDYHVGWQGFLLLYSLLRLGGWGPRPI